MTTRITPKPTRARGGEEDVVEGMEGMERMEGMEGRKEVTNPACYARSGL